MKAKFLVLYPSPENLDAIIKKANLQHARNGPFSAVILLGNSFPAEVPATAPDAPTYCFGKADQEGTFVDVGPNFTCVNTQHAVLKLESGVTLAFFNDTISAQSEPSIPAKADVLFTYNWPYCVAAHQRLTLVGDSAVDKVVRDLQPRYHFAAGSEMGRVYEHSAVAWSPKRTYRFISLAREGTGNKWFYAFGIDTGDDEGANLPKNPFFEDLKRPREADSEAGPPAKLEPLGKSDEHFTKRVKVVAPSECFFCLSNPKLESHMIVSIGQHSYLTIAKGPLTRPNRDLDFSGHAIIVPIDHSATLPGIPEASDEVERYKKSLADAFGHAGYDVVFYEIGRPENVHFHIQMVPVPRGTIGKMFERALDEKCRMNNETFEHNSRMNFQKYSENDDQRKTVTGGRYIEFTVFSEQAKTYYTTALDDRTVDLQFPRRVLAFLLRLPKRVSWDRCKQTTVQETAECEKFKKFYEKYDFTK